MKFETNWGPRSLMTFLGIPKDLKTWSWRSSAVLVEFWVVSVGMILTILVSLSTTMKIASCPLDLGSGPMISMEMVCQGSGGGSWGCSRAARGPCLGLVLWHFSQPLTYLT